VSRLGITDGSAGGIILLIIAWVAIASVTVAHTLRR
jgi:hypothetical protein